MEKSHVNMKAGKLRISKPKILKGSKEKEKLTNDKKLGLHSTFQ